MKDIFSQLGDNNYISVKNEHTNSPWLLVAIVTAILAVIAGLTQEWWTRILWPTP